MNRFIKIAGLSALILAGVCGQSIAAKVALSDLNLSKVQQGWGWPRANKSVDGNELSIAGVKYAQGLGTHAESVLYIDLKGGSTRFTAKVGLDDEVGRSGGSVVFKMLADKNEIYSSGPIKTGNPAKAIDLDVTGLNALILMVESGGDGIDYDHANWVDVFFEVVGEKPVTIDAPREEAVILTPKPGPQPRINGAKVFGVRPGSPILYTIAATGTRPMTFSANNLPAGVALDARTGRLTGSVAKKGDYALELTARNSLGLATATLILKVGDTIALTPPMGWNSWNCWACAVDDAKIRSSAQAMVDSGLINHGWQYINIDDCWMRKPGDSNPALGGEPRDREGMLVTNAKFPDMKGLVDFVHGLGLKAGTYIGPGPLTCAGYVGSLNHEMNDALQFAHWGFDYLKYDWCSYQAEADTLEAYKKPYSLMHDCLVKVDRDIVFSLCQYGMKNVWEWGAGVGGNCWRTTGDIADTWSSMAGIGFNQDKAAPYGGPGHWNDPDMLVVGKVGWGPNLHPSRLTPNEQYTHISLWCLLPSPLLIGCDLADLDAFTLNLLTNDEVLAVNQDPQGKPGQRIWQENLLEIWTRPLADGGVAVGLFNRSEFEQDIAVQWSDLGLEGNQTVRDLWRQKDLGQFTAQFKAPVPRHGVVFVKVGKPAQ